MMPALGVASRDHGGDGGGNSNVLTDDILLRGFSDDYCSSRMLLQRIQYHFSIKYIKS